MRIGPISLILACLLASACTTTEPDNDPASQCAASGCRDIEIHEVGNVPGDGWVAHPDPDADTDAVESGTTVFLRHALTLPGRDIERVTLNFDETNGQPVIDLELTEAAGTSMQALSSSLIGKRIAFTSGGKTISMPYILGPAGSHIRLSGFGSLLEAKQIQQRLRGD